MLSILLISVPTLLYAFGILPTLAITFLTVMLCVTATLRYFSFAMVLSGLVKPAPSDLESTKIQWFYTAASLVAMCAMWFGGPLWATVYFGVTIPISLYYLTKMTLSVNESLKEEA
ncbi:hypothetical protein PHIM7_302 [Sinorhizobium phage phiM7]|uniref:Transmembrane protein n=2 Tax=Emdodecavirus TaxID=1980937 RepID=S5MVV2_9CAUD|nr:hypothetical protein AB690_gp209 [Sinorhizobium phage phiM12]YP_009601427.1 hypothetical protein FDH46_gp176 [Sinorhizobium phage phiM7]AGR48022.1 hypothetical protein SmphiM12_390 [Sinorhizobium phage phiM12]AKF12848.1 hypothetical protein PHIM7_302 [Sinorhizobium phage phiM7]AKF13207.1 hypothetical protein PHIM19_302 [Sinorhizobium phage phiM19]